MINKWDDIYRMKQKENLFPKNAVVGLKASASKQLKSTCYLLKTISERQNQQINTTTLWKTHEKKVQWSRGILGEFY